MPAASNHSYFVEEEISKQPLLINLIHLKKNIIDIGAANSDIVDQGMFFWQKISRFYICCAALSCSVVSDSLWPHGWTAAHQALLSMDSPGKNTGVCCHALLQRIFPTQGSNSGLSHCWWILYQLNDQGSPRLLEWVAYPFSGELPNPGIEPRSPALQFNFHSCIVGRLVTSWTTREDSIFIGLWKWIGIVQLK